MTKIFNRDVIAKKAVKAQSLTITDVGTATASSGAATLNTKAGRVTSESLTTAQNLFYTLTLTNSKVSASSIVLASVANGTNTQGTPMVVRTQPSAGQLIVTVQNKHATSEALNGTIVISYVVVDVA